MEAPESSANSLFSSGSTSLLSFPVFPPLNVDFAAEGGAPAAPRVTKHATFYMEDGFVELKIEHTLFRVHRYFFSRDSEHFRTLFAQRSRDARSDVITVDDPDVSTVDFERFLTVLYPAEFGAYSTLTVEEWTSILRLANKWGFNSIRTLAIRSLSVLSSPVDTIVLARTHGFTDGLRAAYIAVCSRPDALTLEEAQRLGLERVVRIAEARQASRTAGAVASPERVRDVVDRICFPASTYTADTLSIPSIASSATSALSWDSLGVPWTSAPDVPPSYSSDALPVPAPGPRPPSAEPHHTLDTITRLIDDLSYVKKTVRRNPAIGAPALLPRIAQLLHQSDPVTLRGVVVCLAEQGVAERAALPFSAGPRLRLVAELKHARLCEELAAHLSGRAPGAEPDVNNPEHPMEALFRTYLAERCQGLIDTWTIAPGAAVEAGLRERWSPSLEFVDDLRARGLVSVRVLRVRVAALLAQAATADGETFVAICHVLRKLDLPHIFGRKATPDGDDPFLVAGQPDPVILLSRLVNQDHEAEKVQEIRQAAAAVLAEIDSPDR